MEKVLPSTICYAAIHVRVDRRLQCSHLMSPLQTYIGLCCRGEWGEEWKGVKLPHLYLLLRELFAHPDDPWCAETLKWWNEFCPFVPIVLRSLTAP